MKNLIGTRWARFWQKGGRSGSGRASIKKESIGSSLPEYQVREYLRQAYVAMDREGGGVEALLLAHNLADSAADRLAKIIAEKAKPR